MRGGERFTVFYTYNPPESVRDWVHEEVRANRPDRLVPVSYTHLHYNSTLSARALSTDALSGEALSVALYDKTPLLEGSSRLLVTKPGKINAMLNGRCV